MSFLKETKKWEREWKNMPEFIQENKKGIHSITIHFETMDDLKNFSKLLQRKITHKTKSIWFPEKTINERFIYVNDSDEE